ncbi:MAG: tetratricopeptide repeat protein [Propylenella sp.]
MKGEGAVFAIIGALDAFPHRLAARAIEAWGGILRRGVSRGTDIAVVGHRLIQNATPTRIAKRLDEARRAGARLVSERGFLRLLGLARESEGERRLSAAGLLAQSGLDTESFELLRLFDIFDVAEEPFGFRDLVAGRQCAGLIRDGVEATALIRAVQTRSPISPDGGLSQVRLERSEWNRVLMRTGDALTELSGQHILALPDERDSVDQLFEEGKDAEDEEDWERARAAYQRCHAMDPRDPVIAFNLSHALLQLGDLQGARRTLNKVLTLDKRFAEAWFNLASIARRENDRATARRHLMKAIEADPDYPDPIYNLALLEFENGKHDEAARLWARYLELDPASEWGHKARQGLQLIGMMKNPRDPGSPSARDRKPGLRVVG